jgi:DNA primase
MTKAFIDFKALKERVLFEGVLSHYHIELRKSGTELKGNCPLPSHTSKTPDTFYVDAGKNLWYCHSQSCKKNGRAGGNVIDFVAAMEGVAPYDAAAKLMEWYPNGDGQPKKRVPATDESATVNKPLGFTLKDVNPAHEMTQARGISEATAASWGVGYFPGKGSMANRIVFPLHENGNLVGYAGRTTLPVTPENPKWLFGKGVHKTFLYGLERCDPAKPLVLVESLWAALWFAERGLQAAALMGAEMTAEQEKCLEPFGIITVALDNDAAGQEKSCPIAERLRRNHKVMKAFLKE